MKKEEVFEKWYEMSKKSWTYKKLTYEERKNFDNIITSCQLSKCLNGTANHRWDILQAIYYSFLLGVGYDSPTWREEEEYPLF